MKTLFISDLDGTLLQNDARISAKSCEILNRLIERGISFSYATARGFETALHVTEGLHVNMPVITKNGVVTVRPDTGELLAKNTFSKDEAEDIYHILSKWMLSPVVYSYQDGKEKFSYNGNVQSEGVRWFVSEHKNDRRDNPVSGDDEMLSGEVFYFSCIGTKEMLEDAFQEIRRRYRCIFSKDTYNDWIWLEIMPEYATKASAVLQMKEMLGYDYIVAFGDGINDMPMFEIADECYAVENAVNKLKKMATGIIMSNQSDGVADWLQKNFGCYM